MPYQEGLKGLVALFEVSNESENEPPSGPPLTVEMCEVYSRLKLLFPESPPLWRKIETVVYFGKKVGLARDNVDYILKLFF